MLLENIFATSLGVFLLTFLLICIICKFNLDPFYRKAMAITFVFGISGLVTIITAIWWIARAWG